MTKSKLQHAQEPAHLSSYGQVDHTLTTPQVLHRLSSMGFIFRTLDQCTSEAAGQDSLEWKSRKVAEQHRSNHLVVHSSLSGHVYVNLDTRSATFGERSYKLSGIGRFDWHGLAMREHLYRRAKLFEHTRRYLVQAHDVGCVTADATR